MAGPVDVLCIYRVKQGKEAEFRRMLEKHWPTLSRAGLVSSEPARVALSQDRQGRLVFIETFQWKDEGASDRAHQSGEVMGVWEPMGELTEDMEFFHTQPLQP